MGAQDPGRDRAAADRRRLLRPVRVGRGLSVLLPLGLLLGFYWLFAPRFSLFACRIAVLFFALCASFSCWSRVLNRPPNPPLSHSLVASSVEGREIISNLAKAAGLATMIATMRPDIDNVDEVLICFFVNITRRIRS